MPIPEWEFDNYLETVCLAQEAAEEGEFALGFDLISVELDRTDDLIGAGVPFGSELASRYLRALDGYAERHGVVAP